MRRGDFAAAWRCNDAVLAERDPATRDHPALPCHERWVWDGTPPDGRDVLVRCYHGLGDTLQFSRFLTPLSAQARRLTVEAQPELIGFMADGPGQLIPFRPDNPAPPAACTLEIMEAAHVLRQAPDPAPPRRFGPPRRRLRVGVCATAGSWDPARIVSPADLAPLARLAGIDWVNLQLQAGPGWLGPPLAAHVAVVETARLIRSLDLVLTVDTMVAHLSGTLGQRTWVLLKHRPDWRWMDHGDDSPWYPSARLFRQDRPGQWAEPVQRATAALVQLAAAGENMAMAAPH